MSEAKHYAHARSKDVTPTLVDAEGVVTGEGAMLVLHGDVNLRTVPHLDWLLDSVMSMSPLSLLVDLTDTTRVGLEALAAISRRASEVEEFCVRLPLHRHPSSATCSPHSNRKAAVPKV